jgi:hypothetical protein
VEEGGGRRSKKKEVGWEDDAGSEEARACFPRWDEVEPATMVL